MLRKISYKKVRSSEIKDTDSLYLSVTLEDPSYAQRVVDSCCSKDKFVEVIIPINFFSINLLEDLQRVDRIILDCRKDPKNNLDGIFEELVSFGFFPFTLGNNVVEDKFRVEFYRGEINVSDVDAREFLESRKEEDLL